MAIDQFGEEREKVPVGYRAELVALEKRVYRVSPFCTQHISYFMLPVLNKCIELIGEPVKNLDRLYQIKRSR